MATTAMTNINFFLFSFKNTNILIFVLGILRQMRMSLDECSLVTIIG